MRALTPSRLLRIWENAYTKHPVDRAMAILSEVEPERNLEDFANLSIGERDACLFAVRASYFGDRMQAYDECPSCREKVEYTLSIKELVGSCARDNQENAERFLEDGSRYRLPNSYDLAALVGCTDTPEARQTLARRCLEREPEDGSELSPELLTALSQRLAEDDPLVDIAIELQCPICQKPWQAFLDILSFFWQELGSEAQRLLREIHCLASVYGWNESEILALSPVRRETYLSMLN